MSLSRAVVDPAGPLTASLAPSGDVAHGTQAVNADGSFVYHPTPGWHGVDWFGYDATRSDGSETQRGTTTIVVDRIPVAGPDAFTVAPGRATVVPAPGYLANDHDGDGDPLSVTILDSPRHAAAFTAYVDGSFSYQPAVGFTGTDSFRYQPKDGIWPGEPVWATITVAEPPPGGGTGTSTGPVAGSGTVNGAGQPAPVRSMVLAPTTLRVDRRGRAVLGLVCRGPEACAGLFRVTTAGGRAIVSGAYELPAGKRSNTAIRVGPKGRAVLRARGGRALRARLTVTPDGGTSKTTTLTVHAPRSLRR